MHRSRRPPSTLPLILALAGCGGDPGGDPSATASPPSSSSGEASSGGEASTDGAPTGSASTLDPSGDPTADPTAATTDGADTDDTTGGPGEGIDYPPGVLCPPAPAVDPRCGPAHDPRDRKSVV